jgi:flagellar biosynthetic protein FlhB
MSDPSKTEKPTSHRRSEARKKGDVAQSAEVDNLFFLLGTIFVLRIGGSFIYNHFTLFLKSSLSVISTPITVKSITQIYISNFLAMLIIIAPFALTYMFFGIVSSYLQIGWMFTTENIKWKWDKAFNFKMGFSQIFSKQTLNKLFKGLTKLALLFLITYSSIKKEINSFLSLSDLSIIPIFLHLFKTIITIITNLFFAYIIVALIDYAITKYLHTDKMKMTKQEVKDEFKQMEGDPHIRQKLRSLMMAESQKRMMKQVPEADVIITNPTHIAIALQYNPDKFDAPKVLAKGKMKIAEKIKKIAKENNIPIVEDKPLARMLYKLTKVDQFIPVDLYGAVAEILAQVFKLKNKKL